jgi:hypothetical protein
MDCKKCGLGPRDCRCPVKTDLKAFGKLMKMCQPKRDSPEKELMKSMDVLIRDYRRWKKEFK